MMSTSAKVASIMSTWQARQRPVTFRNAMLCDSTFEKVDLSGVKIVNCKLDGMTIDGVPVSELMKAHQDRNQ